MSKTNTNDNAAVKAAAHAGEATRPENSTNPAKASVRIKTTAKVTIGRIVHAPGVTVSVTQEQASALKEMDKDRKSVV